MFVLSLVTSPDAAALDEELSNDVADMIGLNRARTTWLAPGVACDLTLPPMSQHQAHDLLTTARAALADRPVDINLVPTEGRRKKLLIADMDSTMIHQECIDELGIAAGAGEHIREVTRRAMRGELDFVEALRERVSFMKGLPESAIAGVIEDRITFVPGGRTAVATMTQQGAHCALISGGFTQFTRYVAGECGFHEHQANELIIEDGHLAGRVAEPALGSAAKVEALNRLTGKLGLSLCDALTVGDGANDIAMIEAAGMGVAMHAKPAVRDAARFIIDHADLTALLYLQGYRAAEFVR